MGIKKENEQYLELLDKLREQEIKLKKQCNDQQLEIQSLTIKYNEIENKLQIETDETRHQLLVAKHIANNLSDQLEEIHNFHKSSIDGDIDDIGDIDIDHNDDTKDNKDNKTKLMPFGRPLFEKRKTLKKLTIEKKKKKK